MKTKPIALAIPTPCHENWNLMTPAEQGRFCLSCQKTVVDFTAKTDREVARFFENGAANTCGRFRHDQLNRPLRTVPPSGLGPRLRALGLLVPSLLLSGWAQAQSQRQLMGKVACPPKQVQVQPSIGDTIVVETKGEVAIAYPPPPRMVEGTVAIVETTERTISGTVRDRQGDALIGASVIVQGTNLGTISDIDGRYSLKLPTNLRNPVLVFSYTGYQTQEIALGNGESQSVEMVEAVLLEGIYLAGDIVIIQQEETVYDLVRSGIRRLVENMREAREHRRYATVAPETEPQPSPQPAPILPSPTPTAIAPPLQVQVFPNPFSNTLNLRFDNPVAERLQIRLTDMQGQTLLTQVYEAMKGPQVLTLDPIASGVTLPSGQYLLEVSSGTELRFAGMVLKAN